MVKDTQNSRLAITGSAYDFDPFQSRCCLHSGVRNKYCKETRGLKKTKNQLLPKNISSKSLTVFILDQTERMWDNLYLVTFVVSTFNVAFPFSFTQSKLIIFLKKTSILVLGGKTISYFFQVLCRYYYLLMMIIDIHIFCYIFSMARSFIPRRVRFN